MGDEEAHPEGPLPPPPFLLCLSLHRCSPYRPPQVSFLMSFGPWINSFKSNEPAQPLQLCYHCGWQKRSNLLIHRGLKKCGDPQWTGEDSKCETCLLDCIPPGMKINHVRSGACQAYQRRHKRPREESEGENSNVSTVEGNQYLILGYLAE